MLSICFLKNNQSYTKNKFKIKLFVYLPTQLYKFSIQQGNDALLYNGLMIHNSKWDD